MLSAGLVVKSRRLTRLSYSLSRRPFAVIGHSGAAGLEPENTLKALRRALDLSLDLVEVDVRVTRDGEPILLHDEGFERVGGVSAKARELTLRDIRDRIRVGGEVVPTLREALEAVGGRMGVIIDLKDSNWGGVHSVIRVVVDEGAVEWVALVSKRLETLEAAKSIEPRVQTGASFESPPTRVVDASRIGCSLISIHYKLATRATIELAHRLGLKVVAWTVDSEALALNLVTRGVDAVVSNRPDRLIKFRDGMSSGVVR